MIPQEEKDFIAEFLDGLSEGTPLTEVVQRASDTYPNKHYVQLKRTGPWKTLEPTVV